MTEEAADWTGHDSRTQPPDERNSHRDKTSQVRPEPPRQDLNPRFGAVRWTQDEDESERDAVWQQSQLEVMSHAIGDDVEH